MPLERISPELVTEILKEYPALKSLNLSHNEINVFEELDRIVTLERLNLANNQFRELACGGLAFQNLQQLNCSYNQMYVDK